MQNGIKLVNSKKYICYKYRLKAIKQIIDLY